ncbi:hypothetical protein HJC23_001396 [Cyclotella cryptica]|uniref:RRP4 S1 domain-containing protein n=1 Tax=Cyclotella cryptica TaxID=29204 RepID=A0ABD3P816_9STRA|eukprot:CCRYP_016724-RA/>CCRYP_016724-RA protein AED:0.09 eAED:0.09 QI:0/-1/0/1/-1/1/1/0/415
MDSLKNHFVLPGQVLATSHSETQGGFLRGHGTYIELVPHDQHDNDDDPRDNAGGSSSLGGMAGTSKKRGWGNSSDQSNVVMRSEHDGGGDNDDDDDGSKQSGEGEDAAALLRVGPQRLIASVAGTVQRVNKLISVIPSAPAVYTGQVGDLIVGRIIGVGGSRWRVSLTCSPPSSGSSSSSSSMREGQLPLSGVNLPGGVQRIRTSEDVLAMRSLYREGDLLTCEVQNVQKDGTLILHTRSLRYGKLENGVLTTVPPSLVGRRKNHFVTIKGVISSEETNGDKHHDDSVMDVDDGEESGNVDVYLGLNGGIWIQRTIPPQWENSLHGSLDQDSRAPLAETLQKLRQRHANTRVSASAREGIARVRNAIDCLRLVHCQITPESIEIVVKTSLREGVRVKDMLRPEFIVKITEATRSR